MFVVVYFSSRTLIGGESGLLTNFNTSANSATGDLWSDYLILLGGPFAALVFAKGIVTAKVNSGTLQKTVPDDGTASLRQVLTNDDGNPDLVDTQYFIFNLVAYVYVIIGTCANNALPEIPALILVLTSPAAATYVINKSVQSNTPKVSSVVPASVKIGGRMLVGGSNFMQATEIAPLVTIGGVQAFIDAQHASDTQITVTPAPGTPSSFQPMVVTTAARVSTDQVMVEMKT